MKRLYDLRDRLIKQLYDLEARPTFDRVTLNDVDTTAHALKNLYKVLGYLEDEAGEYAAKKDGTVYNGYTPTLSDEIRSVMDTVSKLAAKVEQM